MKPNIFEIATSELSQDALITWLIKWADNELSAIDENLHSCAVNFIRLLVGEKDEYQINDIEAGRQWNNIDVWAEVNNEYFIVIEDKKGTREHSDQLKKYAEIAKQHYQSENIEIILVYFKMEPQGNYSNIEESGFSFFSRGKMLVVLEQYINSTNEANRNDILLDYYSYLRRLDDEINSFRSLPLEQWHWYSWKGFFEEIQKEVGGEWDYVPNARGGFIGLWWDWNHKDLDGKEFDFYLQLEYSKMIFKINVYKSEYRKEIREYYRKILYSVAKKENVNIYQYGRVGQYMGVARLNSDYRATTDCGLIDMAGTIDCLRKMETVLRSAANEMEKQNET